MVAIKSDDAARGAEAELRFQSWLDESRLPYVYTDQTRETVPQHFRRHLKRPDFLVALPYVGTIAFDVKSKALYRGAFLFDVSEIRRMVHFDDLFRISTFLACLEPDDSGRMVWFRALHLSGYPEKVVAGKDVMVVPRDAGQPVDMNRPLQEALREAISLG